MYCGRYLRVGWKTMSKNKENCSLQRQRNAMIIIFLSCYSFRHSDFRKFETVVIVIEVIMFCGPRLVVSLMFQTTERICR